MALAVPRNGSITFFGDVAQQIYGHRITWRSAGLNLTGKPWIFEENYRNSKQIADLALALTKMPYYNGAADLVSPNSPRAAGPPPSLLIFKSDEEEAAFVVKQARSMARVGSVAILTSNHHQRHYFNTLFHEGTFTELTNDMSRWRSGTGISIGVCHSAKGLEFESIILPRLSAKLLPDPDEITSFGEARAQADAGRLLYVGITRARQNLILTCTEEPTNLLPADRKLLPIVTP